ncbi:MAG: AI-2E family transporter [Burkholderiaceae bacterium]|jgi:predicted PurR-regulated permease PerM
MATHLNQPRSLVSTLFTVAILAGGLFVLSPFLLAILWAGIIATAFWPLHCGIRSRWPDRPNLAALCSTLVVAFLLVGPMIGLLLFMINDVINVTVFLLTADSQGVPVPEWLQGIPLAGKFLSARWDEYLAMPDQLSALLREAISSKLTLIQGAAQTILLELLGRGATLFFALWVLFFFYRDGESFAERLNTIGQDWLGARWLPYISQMPMALRAAVNGLVFVSFAEAALLSALFALCSVPSPVLLGSLTALIAFIPMAAPLLLTLLGGLLLASHAVAAGVVVIVIGNLIVLSADYVFRPLLIQGGTNLPFLAILFGVLGGVFMLGIVGLVIGPVLLVLFAVFINEASQPLAEAEAEAG